MKRKRASNSCLHMTAVGTHHPTPQNSNANNTGL